MKCEMKPSGEQRRGIIEYTLMLVLVAIVVQAVLVIFEPQVGNAFSMISHAL